jgi:hypothetical protein
MAQLLRSLDIVAWRQIPVFDRARLLHRADFGLPFRRMHRPLRFAPHHGVLIELDSEAHHRTKFEKDHTRNTTYDTLGYTWQSFTPNQVERAPRTVARAIETKMLGASRTLRGARFSA